MSRSKIPAPRVKQFYLRAKQALRLEALLGTVGFTKKIKADASGKVFSNLQVWGWKEEQEFSQLPGEKRRARLEKRFAADVAIFIFPGGRDVPPEVLELARRHRVAVFRSARSQKACDAELRRILSEFFPKQILISGGLLQIFGLGVLIIGDSGVGKSESALELISRGYKFISDDVTLIKKTAQNTLLGSAPQVSQNFMEIRGLSIINIEQIFGKDVICRHAEVSLAIYLERWEPGKEYDRLGLDAPEKFEILGISIPQITIPVAPGRNISTLIEVACKVHILRKKGYHAAREISRRLDRALSSQ
jgi:HPr kinase/phosphorylase